MLWGRWTARASLLCVLSLTSVAISVRAQDATQASADDQEARDLFRLGKQAFDEGRFERALKYFKDAYDLSRRAQLQFNIGTVLDRLRRDREAVSAYRSYLTQTPNAANRAPVEERIRLLEDALAKSEPPPAAVLQPVAQVPAAATSSAPRLAPTPTETARAAVVSEAPQPAPPPYAAAPAESSEPVTSRWWFWTGVGAAAVGAAVVGVALGTASTERSLEGPAVIGASTRVRPL